MSVRNRPEEYMKRSALAASKSCPTRKEDLNKRPIKNRDFKKADIDDRFYFTFKKDKKNS